MESKAQSLHGSSLTPQVKGVAFRSVMRALERLRGTQVVDATLQALPAELANALRFGTIVTAGWYSIEWYRAILAAAVSTSKQGERILYEIGRESIRHDMTGLYKVAFKILSPQTIFGMGTRLFSNYYKMGTVEITRSEKGFVEARWSKCTGFDRNMFLEIFSATVMLLELAGTKDLRANIISGAGPRDEFMVAQANWK
jgi:hypothetical protein